jgi:hypothetical protein
MQTAVPNQRMRQTQVPPSQLQLKASAGPPGKSAQAHGTVAPVEHEGVPGAHEPYGRAMSMLGYDIILCGHAESPHAAEQVMAAAGEDCENGCWPVVG